MIDLVGGTLAVWETFDWLADGKIKDTHLFCKVYKKCSVYAEIPGASNTKV